jgi:hypothetical protein
VATGEFESSLRWLHVGAKYRLIIGRRAMEAWHVRRLGAAKRRTAIRLSIFVVVSIIAAAC